MISAYASLLRLPGVRTFVVGAAIERLGGAMFGVAVVAMVSGRRGSYGLAGAVSAVGLVVLALTAAVVGRLIDRFGQRRTTLPLAIWSTVWNVAMVVVSLVGAPSWTLFACYGLSAVVANAGTMSRARWSMLLADDPGRLHTAMSFEQVADELSFVAGPVVAIFLATTLFPEAGFIAATVCYLVGALLFLSARSTEPAVQAGSHVGVGMAFRRPGVLLLSLVLFMTGAIFGSNEVVTLAVSQAAGHKGAAGLILALFALGSAASGLLYGARAVRRPLASALVLGTAAMFLLEAPVLLAHQLGWLAVVMLVAGMATAPTLITGMNLAQQLVPARQLNEAMNLVLTGLIVGVAAGSALGGALAQAYGAHQGYWVPVAAGACAVVIALAGRRTLHPRNIAARNSMAA